MAKTVKAPARPARKFVAGGPAHDGPQDRKRLSALFARALSGLARTKAGQKKG